MELGEHAKSTKKITDCFHSSVIEDVQEEEEEEEDEIGQMLREAEAESERQAEAHVEVKSLYSNESLQECMKELRDGLATSKKKVVTEWDGSFIRVLAKALLAYYSTICYEGKSRMEASQSVAFYFYQKDKRVNACRARMIRAWGNEHLKTKSLPAFMQQGAHSKVRSIVTDEDIQHKLKSFLRSMKDFDRTPGNFCAAYNNDDDGIRSSIPGSRLSICPATAGRWMEILGFENRRLTKSYYTDGHEKT